MPTITVRASRDSDLPAIAAIYAHHVRHGTGSFEIEAPSAREMAQRRAEVLGRGLPYLVAQENDMILGYAYCNWFRQRPAYRFTVEDSVYLAVAHQGPGLGRALLAELLTRAETAGVRRMVAVIGDSANRGSVQVHRAVGFTPVGVFQSVGWKFGRWLDVVMMERALGLGDSQPPLD